MHDSRFYEKEKTQEVAIYENKHGRGRSKGKGYTIDAVLKFKRWLTICQVIFVDYISTWNVESLASTFVSKFKYSIVTLFTNFIMNSD